MTNSYHNLGTVADFVEILRLRAENKKLRAEYAALVDSYDAQFLEIEKLRAALKPFEIIAQWDAEDRVLVPVYIIRAAAAALKETGDE